MRRPYMRQGRGIRGTVIVLSEPLSPESKSLNAFLRTALHSVPKWATAPMGALWWPPVLIFLWCVFSHVSSGCLHGRVHSYTGCICLTQSVYPHCTTLSKMGYCPRGALKWPLVLIFLQCVFSHVSSKCLHRRMHSNTGSICLTQSVSPHCTAQCPKWATAPKGAL